MIPSTKRFILVDDDPLTNSLSKLILKKAFAEAEVIDFLEPEEALNYIQTEFEMNPSDSLVTLFLDINMPSISGWEFLEKFNDFKDSIKKQFNIYILSSSIDPSDISRAETNPLVKGFIEKPLNKTILTRIYP